MLLEFITLEWTYFYSLQKSEKSSYLEQARLWREEVIGYEDLFKKNKTEALEHQRSTHGSYNYKLAEVSFHNT